MCLNLDYFFILAILMLAISSTDQAQTTSPRSIFDRIPFEKWAPAVDRIFGKVEDWRPLGIKSVNIVGITTTSTTTTTTTTTTPKPPPARIPLQTVRAHAGEVIRVVTEAALKLRPDLGPRWDPQTIIDGIGTGGSGKGPKVLVGNVLADGQAIPYANTNKAPDLTYDNVRMNREGFFIVVMFNYVKKLNYYMVRLQVDGGYGGENDPIDPNTVKLSQTNTPYHQPEKGTKDIITFCTFKSGLTGADKDAYPFGDVPFDNFEIDKFQFDYIMRLIDVSAFYIE